MSMLLINNSYHQRFELDTRSTLEVDGGIDRGVSRSWVLLDLVRLPQGRYYRLPVRSASYLARCRTPANAPAQHTPGAPRNDVHLHLARAEELPRNHNSRGSGRSQRGGTGHWWSRRPANHARPANGRGGSHRHQEARAGPDQPRG